MSMEDIQFNADQADCSHPTNWVESEVSEDGAWAFCTNCGKDLTRELLDSLPDIQLPDFYDEIPF